MTIALPSGLPASTRLQAEGCQVMAGFSFARVTRPVLRIGLVNLMPDKITTETQFARQLAATGKPIELVLLRPKSHISRNTCQKHLSTFYQTLDEARHQSFDGVIITGAPVETLPFEDVDYWSELTSFLDWIRQTGTCSLFVCWAAQAALNHYYSIPKRSLHAKASGVFQHQVFRHGSPVVSGMGTQFPCPVSRHTEVQWNDLMHVPDLHVAAASRETGVGLVEDQVHAAFYMFNHLEYDAETLSHEYERDLQGSTEVSLPRHYFPNDNPNSQPALQWAASARRFFTNWVGIAGRSQSRKTKSRSSGNQPVNASV